MNAAADDGLAMFSVHGPRITARRPRTLVAESLVSQEAFIEIDSNGMDQKFLLQLMHYIGSGQVRVRVAAVAGVSDIKEVRHVS